MFDFFGFVIWWLSAGGLLIWFGFVCCLLRLVALYIYIWIAYWLFVYLLWVCLLLLLLYCADFMCDLDLYGLAWFSCFYLFVFYCGLLRGWLLIAVTPYLLHYFAFLIMVGLGLPFVLGLLLVFADWARLCFWLLCVRLFLAVWLLLYGCFAWLI